MIGAFRLLETIKGDDAAMLRCVRGSNEIARIEANNTISEVPGNVARKRDRLDIVAISVEELPRYIRDISRHSSEPLQRLEGDATAYLCSAVTQCEVDGAPYSIGNPN
jgi:hypothetical protein